LEDAVSRVIDYPMATGVDAVGRLALVHRIYSPAGCEALLKAGLAPGMRVADFGCGTGAMIRMLTALAGPDGSVTGIDVHADQLEQAAQICEFEAIRNAVFVTADARSTGLPSGSFDLVYCRSLLIHLKDPAACVEEMWRVLRPGGLLVVEEADLLSACSVPTGELNAFAGLFARLGQARGVDYSLGNRLWHLIADAGFAITNVKIHQPAERAGATGLLLKWSVMEAGPALVSSGLIPPEELARTIAAMENAAGDPEVLALAPRMSIVSARKRGN